jgi:hypothetical protein
MTVKDLISNLNGNLCKVFVYDANHDGWSEKAPILEFKYGTPSDDLYITVSITNNGLAGILFTNGIIDVENILESDVDHYQLNIIEETSSNGNKCSIHIPVMYVYI